jgi:hypothetical protein
VTARGVCPVRVVIRSIAGASCGASGGFPNGVVEDDPVGVVDDLGFEAKLDRLAQTSFPDRAGIDIVQADQPTGRFRHHSGQAATGLRDNAFGASHNSVQVVDRPAKPAFALPVAPRNARLALRITAAASRMAASAIPANSPVIRRTAAWA